MPGAPRGIIQNLDPYNLDLLGDAIVFGPNSACAVGTVAGDIVVACFHSLKGGRDKRRTLAGAAFELLVLLVDAAVKSCTR